MPGTLIFYEAAVRLVETLADLSHELGPRPAAVARELTKLHRGGQARRAGRGATDIPRGRAPRARWLIVVGAADKRAVISEAALDQEIAEQLTSLSVKDAAAAIAAKHRLQRRQVYARALAIAGAQR